MEKPHPTPILPHVINLVLQFIAPPSQLQSLPPHLISKPLLQRHHFLQLSPQEPHDYLCWPSPHQHQTIQLLESFLCQPDDHQYSVRYTSDTEYTYAHVRITPDDLSGLRIVFQWDGFDAWKYHNANLMPFPPHSFTSLHDAMSTTILDQLEIQSQHDFLEDHSPTVGAGDDESPSDDDAYWNAYGKDDENDRSEVFDVGKDDAQDGTEDAYWAQYASVQGSGDSTLPSPRLNKPSKLAHLQTDPAQHAPHEPIIFSYSSMHPPTAHSNLEPPSPNTLTDRLNAISPRPSSPLIEDELESPDEFSASGSDSATPSPPPGLVKLGVKSAGSPERRLPVDLNIITSSFLGVRDNLPQGKQKKLGSESDEEEQEALKESVRGIYRMWKAGRRRRAPTPQSGAGTMIEKELFLDIIREVVAEP